MKRFEVIHGGSQPSLTLRYSIARRLAPLIVCILALAGAVYWGLVVLPNENVQPFIGYSGLAVLVVLFIVSLFSAINRSGTYLVLGPETLTGQVFGIFGAKAIEVSYSDISSVGLAGQGDAPAVLVTCDDKSKLRLPGVLFHDRPEILEILQERVTRMRTAVADNVELPKKFRPLFFGWAVVLSSLIVTIPLVLLSIADKSAHVLDLIVAGIVFLILPYLAFSGSAPFVTYSTEGKLLTRKPWFRPDQKRTTDLRAARGYLVTRGPRRKLQLFDEKGETLMALEISHYDFSSALFWAERALAKVRS
jgi:hypothetical protein